MDRKLLVTVVMSICLMSMCFKPIMAQEIESISFPNSGFEDSTEVGGWDNPDPMWAGEIKIVSSPEVNPHSGKNCLSITPVCYARDDDPYRTIVFTPPAFKVEDGDKVRFTLWVRGKAGPKGTPPGLSMIFKCQDEGELCWWFNIKPTENWTQYIAEPEQVKYERINGKTVRIGFDIIGEGTVYIDDVSIQIKRPAKETH